MSIILEGPDNAGKTTLAMDLRKLCSDVVYHHSGGRPTIEEIGPCLEEQLNLSKRLDVLIDRVTSISEQVYRPGMFGNVYYQSKIRGMLNAEHCVVIYCRPPTDRLVSQESIEFRDEENEETRSRILENLHSTVEKYDALMTSIPHIPYDYTDELGSAWVRKYVAEAYKTGDWRRLQEMSMMGRSW